MADDTNTAEREAFEAWIAESGREHMLKLDPENGWYENLEVTARWAAWQARASIAASAGGEPVKRVFLVHTGGEHEGEATYTRHDDAPPPLCDSECLYTHPSPPEGAPAGAAILCWVNEDELPEGLTQEAYSALFPHSRVDMVRMFPVFGPTAQAAPVGAGTWAHLKLMMEESAWGGQILLSDALANIDEFAGLHHSPPEGAGWRQGVEAAAALLSKKADDFAKEHGHDDMGGLSFGRGAHADAKLDYHSGLLELADEVREMRSEPTPELSSDSRVLMEHSGCGRGTQIDTLTVRLNPGDKVILCPGPITRASIAAPPLPASEAKEL